MVSRTLVIIASPEDHQSTTWYKICSNARNDVVFLSTISLNKEWNFSIYSDESPKIFTSNYSFSIDDPKICWYLRGPVSSSRNCLEKFSLLHRLLSLYSYPNGNYFLSGDEEGRTASKLSQGVFSQNKFPLTYAVSVIPFGESNKKDLIVKSISGVRSIVVKLSDDRLGDRTGRQVCPVQLQKVVVGIPIKVHFYRTRNNRWLTFAVASESSEMDYRYANLSEYFLGKLPYNWLGLAEYWYSIFSTRFFDVDFILEQSGNFVFLEINFSPAPTFFESMIWQTCYRYSVRILNDWLNGGNNHEF